MTLAVERVKKGFENLEKHIENMKKFGLNPVVAINSFFSDSDDEVQLVQERCANMGVKAVVSEGFTKGGEGLKTLPSQ